MQGRFGEWWARYAARAICCAMCTVFLVVFGLMAAFLNKEMAEMPHYSVAINSAAGLDPGKDLGRPTLNPEFDLTLGVASRAFMGRQCVDEDEIKVEVSYRGVLLATSGPAKKLCAEARSHREELVVAFGVGVHVPGFVRDSLAADIRRVCRSTTLHYVFQATRWCRVALGR